MCPNPYRRSADTPRLELIEDGLTPELLDRGRQIVAEVWANIVQQVLANQDRN
jgi:hypothetical protein